MKSTVAFATHEEYMASLPEEKRADIQPLYELIIRVLPNYERAMFGNFMGFGRYKYQGKTCAGEWFHVGLTANKTGFSLYVCCTENGKYLAEEAKDKLGKATVGKSCIRTSKLANLNLDEVEKLLARVKEIEGEIT